MYRLPVAVRRLKLSAASTYCLLGLQADYHTVITLDVITLDVITLDVIILDVITSNYCTDTYRIKSALLLAESGEKILFIIKLLNIKKIYCSRIRPGSCCCLKTSLIFWLTEVV